MNSIILTYRMNFVLTHKNSIFNHGKTAISFLIQINCISTSGLCDNCGESMYFAHNQLKGKQIWIYRCISKNCKRKTNF